MECSNWKSSRYGSYFENTRIPIYKIVKIIHCFITSVKIEQACQIVQLSKSTVIDWFQRFRYLTALDLDKKEIKLGGKSKIVEIDESMYARVKHFKGKDLQYMSKKKQLWVILKYVQSKKLITEKHLKQDPHSLSDEFLTYGVADFMCVEKFFTEDGYRAALLLYEKKV